MSNQLLPMPAEGRLLRVLREEMAGVHVRLLLLRLMAWPLPPGAGGRLRACAMRLVGFRVGRGTSLADLPRLTGGRSLYANLSIGARCWLNVGCRFDLDAAVVIGDDVSIGQEVLLLTSSHVIGSARRRAGALDSRPVSIGDGAWVGARSTVLPGVRIGRGAVVAAGSLVCTDVAADAVVAGVPARPMRSLR